MLLIALATLVVAVLLYEPARQLYWILTVDPGYRPDHIARFRETFMQMSPAERKEFYAQRLERMRARNSAVDV